MSALAQVPAWFWITLATIVALAGLVAGVWWSADRRYRPEHRAQPAEPVDLPVMLASVPVAAVSGKPPWGLAHEPTAAEVAASRALHGYIPELDTDDLGPGAGWLMGHSFQPGYNSHLPSGAESVKVDSPAPVSPPRLAPGMVLALARSDTFMEQMRADHARWLASARERWAAA